jgi:enediyne polyketide synthase
MLAELRIEAAAAVGHSLGELAALHWAGAFDEAALLRLASARGAAMGAPGGPSGAMASLAAADVRVRQLIGGLPVVIACFNSPSQTVVSGESTAVASVVSRAREAGIHGTILPVSHAFHSPLVAGCVPVLVSLLAQEQLSPLSRTVFSTVTGSALAAGADLRSLLCEQVTSPVRFIDAVLAAGSSVDLWIEAGPGDVLSRLAAECTRIPSIAVDGGGVSFAGLLKAAGAAYVLGCPVRLDALFEGRVLRRFALDWQPKFFRSPCENAPTIAAEIKQEAPKAQPEPSCEPAGASGDALEIVRELVATRAELPSAHVEPRNRMLSDLHLNSIIVAQVVTEAARRLGVPPPIAPTQYADATISDIAEALTEAAAAAPEHSGTNGARVPDGVDSWIRCFRVAFVERPPPATPTRSGPGRWLFYGDGPASVIEPFRRAFAQAPGEGVVVFAPGTSETRAIRLLVEAGRAVLAARERARFVLIESAGGGAFARTLHLEAPEVTCCVVSVPLDHPKAPGWAVGEAIAASGYTEAHYDRDGVRRIPVLEVMNPEDWPVSGDGLLRARDVLLVSGGGKGIGAECALHLARTSGARLLLLGRSNPAEDAGLAANLTRMADAGIVVQYASADVTDADSVRRAVAEGERILGPVTAVLHAAGSNTPRLIASLDAEAFERTVKPKTAGLRNVLAAVQPEQLRLLITFGSLIARTGLPGEADYGTANEWLRIAVDRWAKDNPLCRCLHLDWSVWAGAGMGERLGRLETLVQRGITPIPLEEGLRVLGELVRRNNPETAVVVTGRFGDPATITVRGAEPPFLRFLERVRVWVPGVELIADSEISTKSDPYLDDHIYDGSRLVPAVIGLEAMTQAAMCLLNTAAPPQFEHVEFQEAITVPASGDVVVRVAALAAEPGCCRVAVRSSLTAFQLDHFRAVCKAPGQPLTIAAQEIDAGLASLAPDDLYGELLFHSGRFRRLRGYRWLRSKECVAEIAASEAANWFARYLPAELVLGDPAARDAAIHAIQACIPHASLLPVGVQRIMTGRLDGLQSARVHAREVESDGQTFVYDVDICNSSGVVVERWEALRLRRVKDVPVQRSFPVALLGPLLERRLAGLMPSWQGAVVVAPASAAGRREQSISAIQQSAGSLGRISHRPDGKPELNGTEWQVSSSHTDGLTVAVNSEKPVACDVEGVRSRPESAWFDLLGVDRFVLAQLIAGRAGIDLNSAATHVWTAAECLVKAGAIPGSPLLLEKCAGDGSLLFSSGARTIATIEVPGMDDARVFAFLTSTASASCDRTSFATS